MRRLKNILVTGGAGFIGSCFIRHELKKHPDYKIINIDALTYCGNIENLVETSLNLGVLRTAGKTVSATFAVRSGVDSEKEKLIKELESIAAEFGADMKVYGEYPAWEFTENSPLQKTMTDVFYEMYGGKMNVAAIHAGLECGIFCGKIKGLDCVSFGPDILEIHTPRERLSISSVERTWRYLIKVLERI